MSPCRWEGCDKPAKPRWTVSMAGRRWWSRKKKAGLCREHGREVARWLRARIRIELAN